MTDDNWQKVREVFDSALRYRPEERRNFVHQACGEDKLLLAEVESLLSSLDSAENFLETPAVAKVVSIIVAEPKQLEAGKCFGHYEIIKQLGAGGMGEVYLARDKKLDRQVAVKILNEKFNRDESSLQRFISEAKAASALNHPNILVIHEIGESEDTHYIISEFIQGKTLREMFKEKSLNLSEILDIFIQIANALAAAHAARIVHRDIKPENIMIRPDGYVKILDFGLAKLVEQKNITFLGLEDSTIGSNQTAEGVIFGTVNYMSPEQAKGERVDERTDIFSFGVVIYEMLAGRTPFAGDSVLKTFANFINAEPSPLSRFAATLPDDLQQIVSKMLRENADERYQTMKDVLTDLKDLKESLRSEKQSEKSLRPENDNKTETIKVTISREKRQTFLTDWNFAFRVQTSSKNNCYLLLCCFDCFNFEYELL
jgi:serine/threonine protein kinase